MQRWVLHIDMDAFFASCEQLTRPTLAGRPVLVGGTSGRGVVAGASYEARALGARSAMPMYQAKTLIGYRGVVVTPRSVVYKALSKQVFQILHEHAGVVEQVSIDEGFMEPPELSGATPDEVAHWAENLRSIIRAETGLAASVGAGNGKQFAKIASDEAKPDGVFVVPATEHRYLIAPLAVGKLWGVGPVTKRKLEEAGVATIGDLAALSEAEAMALIGNVHGRSLWLMAQGIDDRVVAPRASAKQISAEHTYPKDLLHPHAVDAALERAAQQAHKRLLEDGRAAKTITVKLRLSDFQIQSRSHTLPTASTDYEVLLQGARKLVRYPAEVGAIRLVGVGFSGLTQITQDMLFPELDQVAPASEVTRTQVVSDADLPADTQQWHATQDVQHASYGHGWIQGIGHGKVSVRFETRSTGPGRTYTFDADDPKLQAADPLNSLL